jgi:hypothetical protein
MEPKILRKATPNDATSIELAETDDYFHISCNGLWVASFPKSAGIEAALDHANRMIGGMVKMIEFQIRTAESSL